MMQRYTLGLLVVALFTSAVRAADATFNRDANASWNVATNWLPTNGVPNGIGEWAWLTNNISAQRTLTLDANITIGHLTLGDSNNSHGFIINNGTNGSLTLDSTNAQASIVNLKSIAQDIHATMTNKRDVVVDTAGNVTLGGVLTESGGSFGIVKQGTAMLVMTNNNVLSGNIVIGGGVLRGNGTNTVGTGNWAMTNGVLELAGDIFRNAGTGAFQMQVPSGESGFSINGGADRTARFGASGSSVTWGSSTFNPSVFILGQSNANRAISWDNIIDMGGASRRIDVKFTANIATLSRVVTNGTDFVKGGIGTLRLGSSNSWSGSTIVTGGTLRLNFPGALPAGNLALYDGVLELGRNTQEGMRSYGAGAGAIQLSGNSGWGAQDAERVIFAGSNSAVQVWGVDGFANLGALVLNGPNANGNLKFMNTLDLNGSTRTVTVNAGSAVLAGGITNSGAEATLVKNGNGLLLVEGASSGIRVLTVAGTLQLGDFWKSSAELPVPSGNSGVLPGSAGTIVFANAGLETNTITGSILTAGSLTKSDRELVVLANSNLVAGNLTVNRGTLLLDFSSLGASAINVVTGSALVLGNSGFDGGTIRMQAASGGSNEQRFRSMTLNASAQKVIADGSSGTMSVFFSNITRNAGATVDLVAISNGLFYTSSTNVFGILGGYATYNGETWAESAATVGVNPILPYSAFTEVNGGAIADASNNNVRISGSTTLGSAVTTISTLTTTNNGTASDINLAGNTLRLSQRGGILLPPGAGALTIGAAANDGVLTAGQANNTAGDLIFINNGFNGITVNSTITNNGSGAIALVKAGADSVRFMGNVHASAQSFFNEGEARFSGRTSLTNIAVNGGKLWLDSTSTNLHGGNTVINAGMMIIDSPYVTANEIQLGTIAGARAVLRINSDVTVSRLRGGVNDNIRQSSAIFHDAGIVFSAIDGNGTTIADGFSSYGYYRLSGGSITGNMVGTFRGLAVFDQVGGALWPSNNLQPVNSSGTAVFNIFGGSFNAPATASAISINPSTEGGATTFINLLGGEANVALNNTAKTFDLAPVSGNTAYFNLTKGTLTANQIKATSPFATTVFNFNGGTLASAAGNTLGTTFFSGLSATYIRPAGAFIDCNTNAITIGQALLAPTGYGLSTVPVSTNCGGSYIGAPYVKITGGSGAGAQAIAQMNFATGSITNFIVTSPGSGYDASDVLTVSLVGGGPLIAPTDFTVSGGSLSANSSGGLTKFGRASLTLTNANTYTGTTTIQTGILVVTHASALGTTNGVTIINSTGASTNGGQLQLAGNKTYAEDIIIVGTGDGGPAFLRALDGASGTNTLTGTITLNSNRSYRIGIGAANSTLNLGLIQRATNFSAILIMDPVAGGVVNISQPIDNNGGQLTCHGGGLVVLNASSNDLGFTVVQNSTALRLNADQALPPIRDLQLGNGAGNTSTGNGNDRGFLYLEAPSLTLNALIGYTNGGSLASSSTNRLISSTTPGYKLLTVGHTNGSSRFDGIIADGTGGGLMALNKNGTGTQTLAAASTFTGQTRVNAGVLNLAAEGALASTSIVVAAGAKLDAAQRNDGLLNVTASQTLSGNGNIGGTVLNFGKVAPGESAGTLTINGDYADAGTLDIELESATSNDILVVTSNSTLSGTLKVSLINGYIPSGGEVFIIHQASSVTGTFATTNLPALPGLGFDVQYLPNAVALSVTGAPTGYFGYSLQITNSAQRGITDDPDADGYANLLEYATASNPTNADNTARIHSARSTNGLFALRFNRNINALDVTYIVEGSYAATNDAEWIGIATNIAGSWGTANVTEAGGPTPLETTVEDTAPPATNRFLRLRVTIP